MVILKWYNVSKLLEIKLLQSPLVCTCIFVHNFTAFLSAHNIIHERTNVFFDKNFDDLSRFLGMFREINEVIREHVEALSRRELEKVIWANARLNNRTGELISGDLFYAELHCIVLYYTVSVIFILSFNEFITTIYSIQ